MRCPRFVGRDEELTVLGRALDGARTGRGSWVTVLGEAGIGKSRLAAELGRRVDEAGGRVVLGRCSLVDRATPYRALAEALMGAARTVGRPDGVVALRPYLPAVERFLPQWRGGASAIVSESPAVVGESLVRVLSWLGGDEVLLVVLEDLHWADPDTVALCDYVIDHLDGTRLVTVATARDGELPGSTMTVLRRALTLELKPLSPGEVAEVAAGCLGGTAPTEVVQRLHRVAEGLPLLVEDLLSDDASSRFDELVRARLRGLSLTSRRLVVVAALLGERFDRHRLSLALAGDDASMVEGLQDVIAAQLVVADGEAFRFRHALTRDAVLASAPGLAAGLAAAVAKALECSGRDDDLGRAADLWSAAGDAGRATWLLWRAAEVATRRGASAGALDLLQRAADVAPDRATRTVVEVGLLDLLVTHGRVGEALSVGAALLDTSADQQAVHRSLARALLDGGRVDDAIAHLDVVKDGAERLVLWARATLATSAADRRITAEHLAHQAVAAAEIEHRPAVACEALEIVARCARSRSLADAASALQRALAIAEVSDLAAWRLRVLNELGTVEMLRAADGSRLHRAYDEAMRAGALDVAVGIEVNIAALHAMRGELDETRAAAERAEAAARRLGMQPLVAAALVMQALSDGFRGRRDPMERRLRAAEQVSPADADLHAFAWGAGRGICALVREERDEAIRSLRHAVQPNPPVGSLDTARGPLLLVLAASGEATPEDVDAARATATPGAGWSDLWLGYGQAALGGGLAAFGPADVSARRHPLFRAIGLRLLAEAAIRDQWGDPVTWLRVAEAVFVAGGQDRIASACRGLLKRVGASATRRRGADRALAAELLRSGVTAREAEVLELVGERLGNKQIAARLFVSARTVEKHVASLLAKLAVPDRSTLVEIARRS
ncbi:MAG: ATP-binding protein [Acidimicrobiales bacterium]